MTATTNGSHPGRKNRRNALFVHGDEMRVSAADAAWIIGCSADGLFEGIADDEFSVDERNRLSLGDVEAYALTHYEQRNASGHWPTSYWLDASETARQLGITPGLVRQLCDVGVLPFARRPNGERLYRRQQVNVLVQTRLKRQLVEGRRARA